MNEYVPGQYRKIWLPDQNPDSKFVRIRDLSNLPYRRKGSGWLLFGMFFLLLLTALAGTYAYVWATFWENSHPLHSYWPFALFAWILTGLGAGYLRSHPLPGNWNLLQLLIPFILLGIWLAVVYAVDARYEPVGGTTCFIAACG